VALFVLVVAGIVFIVWVAGLPGRIAIARKHPEAEAVKLLGWAGFLPVVPWIQAFIWAFKPTNVVDIRRFPLEERQATEAAIARLTGKTPPAAAKAVASAPPAVDSGGQG
jgi:hypothetical protein